MESRTSFGSGSPNRDRASAPTTTSPLDADAGALMIATTDVVTAMRHREQRDLVLSHQ
jgi:hypothetical protein